jgi:hypothetical protein
LTPFITTVMLVLLATEPSALKRGAVNSMS